MRVKPSLLIYLSLLAGIWRFTDGFEPVTTVISLTAVTIAGVSLFGKPLYCVVKECCDERWIKDQLPNLKTDLEAHVYGQHLAINSAVRSLRGHLRTRPQKALVLSFHGWTGTGKNLIAKIIAENMYEKGMKSEYVHVLSATKHFSRHELAADYKDQISSWIAGNMTGCGRQLFIFDEVEKMPDGVLDVLKPYLDHYDNLQGVDYRKAVFIFLGNAGGEALYQKTYNHFLSGKNREDFELVDTEKLLWKEAYNAKGGLKISSLISSNLISHHIPFLPLEKTHIRRCIEDELKSRNFTKSSIGSEELAKMVSRIMGQLSFTPPNVELYSTSGCKRVFEKTNLVIEELYDSLT